MSRSPSKKSLVIPTIRKSSRYMTKESIEVNIKMTEMLNLSNMVCESNDCAPTSAFLSLLIKYVTVSFIYLSPHSRKDLRQLINMCKAHHSYTWGCSSILMIVHF